MIYKIIWIFKEYFCFLSKIEFYEKGVFTIVNFHEKNAALDKLSLVRFCSTDVQTKV